MSGAGRGFRAPDARAFNAPLYRLSYPGIGSGASCGTRTPRLPARQAGTLAADLTRREEQSHPVTGSGAALSLRPISAFEARARRRLLCLVSRAGLEPALSP